MGKVRIAITGATGLIGRNLLFEIIKQNLNRLSEIEIFILGRCNKEFTLQERIRSILKDDGLLYIDTNVSKAVEILNGFNKFLYCINFELDKPNLNLSREGFRLLSSHSIDFFYHVGASTDLRHGKIQEQIIQENNVNGTFRVLSLLDKLKVGEFCYIGTAYSCGEVQGRVFPDYINLLQKFRNPYEKAKLEAEILVREYAKARKQKCRFFRPSVTCGRLIEGKLGSINKFDVFYGWGAFFLNLKAKMIGGGKNLYDEPISMNMRICFNQDSGLNIVPCDYVAKIIYLVSTTNHPDNNFHLVADQECPHLFYITEMFKMFQINGVKHVPKEPKDTNDLEKLYYKTVGKIFTPYINQPSIIFDVTNLEKVKQKHQIECPAINKSNLNLLYSYAKKFNFGSRL